MLKKLKNIEMPCFASYLIMISGLLNSGFCSLAQNRIVSSAPVSVEEIAGKYYFIFFIVLLPVIFKSDKLLNRFLKFVIVFFVFYTLLFMAGDFASQAVKNNHGARFSLSSGFWFFSGGVIFFYVSLISSEKKIYQRVIFQIISFLPFFVFSYYGFFSDFAVAIEFALNSKRFFVELKNHFYISYGSVFMGCCVGIPLGIYLFRSGKNEKKVFYFLNIIQTIPGIAFFTIMMAPLAFLSTSFLFLQKAGISGVGTAPAVIVLFLYSLLPVVRNTVEGLKIIDGSVIESGRGMGMKSSEIFFKIELPLSLPVILNGIRVALVHCVGSTAVAALIGAGGLGVFIFQGIGQGADDLILLGTFPLIIMAVISDRLMEFLTQISKPGVLADDRN